MIPICGHSLFLDEKFTGKKKAKMLTNWIPPKKYMVQETCYILICM